MESSVFDLIVIGGGPGGYVAAIRAAQLGMRVACIEKEASLGGTCLNVGCIPSKALLDSSEHYSNAKAGLLEVHGIGIKGVSLNLEAMMARKDKVVTILTRGVAGLLRKNKIEWIKGSATITAPDTVAVSSEERRVVHGKRILIATGSAPAALPALPFDGAQIISSTEALGLARVPKRLIVIGAGAVGLELGSVWSRLGADVLVVEFMERIVPGMDGELAGALQRALEKQGLKFRLRTTAKGAEKTRRDVRLTLESEGTQSQESCDVVLVAVGRVPYTAGLGLQELGVQLDDRGRILVDESFATTVNGVYAVGDVIRGPMLAHKAEEEGIAAVERMAGRAGHVNYDAIPSIVYTWPELASVGITSEEAARRKLEVRVGSFPFSANARAKCMNETTGAVKVIADARTDRLLGVHVLGPRASDLIAEAAVAMEFHASAEDIARSVHAHPTLAEAMKEAALAVDGRTINI